MYENNKITDKSSQLTIAEEAFCFLVDQQPKMLETVNRLMALFHGLPTGFCHKRRCRHARVCVGPMVPSQRQLSGFPADHLTGRQHNVLAFLPRCLETLPLSSFRLLLQTRQWFIEDYKACGRAFVESQVRNHTRSGNARDAVSVFDTFTRDIWDDEYDQVMQVVRFGRIVTPSTLHEPGPPAAPKPDDGFADDLPDWLRNFDLSARAWEEGVDLPLLVKI